MGLHLTTSLRRFTVAVFALFAVLFCVSTASAATYTVTSTTDTLSGDCTAATCSLRDATIAANATPDDDVINIPAGTYTLTLPTLPGDTDTPETGDLDITRNGAVTLQGESPRTTVIDASGLGDRVAQAQDNNNTGSLTVDRLRFTGGNTSQLNGQGEGAGLAAVGATTITNSTFDNNTGGVFGGGLYLTPDNATDDIVLKNSTISNNRTTVAGAGIVFTGNDIVTVENNTITDNVSTSGSGTDAVGGAGIYFFVNGASATLNFRHNTVTRNRVISGGTQFGSGIYGGINSTATRSVNNNIIAGNVFEGTGTRQGGECINASDGGVTALFATADGVNLDTDSTCFSSVDSLHADPQLGPLQNNGGFTDTVAIARTSPAFNAGTEVAGAPTTDQRGVTRPQLGARDLGSFELTASSDVAVSGVASPQTVNTGDTVTFTYTVTNSGDTATGVKLTDNLPNGLSYVSGTSTQGSCTPGVSCELGTLTSGASVTVSIVAKTDAAGTYTNTAAVSADQDDPENTNNSVSLNTQVNTPDTSVTNPVEPTSTTVKPVTVRQHSALLRGTVDPKSRQTVVYFEYGIDRGYGSRTANQVVSGDSAVAVSALVDGLQLGKTYHYRVVSVSDAGTTYGADTTFKTQGRLLPKKVSISVTPRHDRKYPYSFTTTGKISLPTGVSTADGCSGKIAVVVKRGKSTLSSRVVNVRRDCTYKSSVAFKRYNARRSGKLTVEARYAGNKSLLRRTSARIPVRFGR